MNCIYCGASVPDHAPFCPACGRPQAKQQTNTENEATKVSQPGLSADVPAFTNEAAQSPTPGTPEKATGGNNQQVQANVSPPAYEPTVMAGPPSTSGSQYPAYPPNSGTTPGGGQYQIYPDAIPGGGSQYQIYPSNPGPTPSGNQYPTYPDATPSGSQYPNYNIAPAFPPQYQPAPPAKPREPHAIARPLPLWAFLVGIVLILALFVVLQISSSDWANGTLRIAIAAGSIAGVLIIVTCIRSLLGMASLANEHRVRQYVSSIVLIVLLFMSCGVALLLQSPLHIAQGQSLEGQKQWQQAIKQYQQGGEKAPNSEHIALTYTEWGESLSKALDYAQAVNKFDTVITYYQQASNAYGRAQKDKLNAYIDWGKQAADKKNYTDAGQHFDDALKLTNCDNACKDQVGSLDATAYFNIGESKLTSKSYDDAISAFKAVQSRFPNAPEAKQSHGDLAKALLGKGKQDRAGTCSLAIPTYQDLSSNFSDTPEGQQAKLDLAASQPVKGHFTTGVPATSNPFALLMQGLSVVNDKGDLNVSDSELFQRADAAPRTNVNANGTFAFGPMKQGTYQLVWGYSTGSGTQYVWSYTPSTHEMAYSAQVGQLCPYDIGDITASFVPK